MRLWRIHPKYLDNKGLGGLWREAIQAKNIIEGKTIGYKNHSALQRFYGTPKKYTAINSYLNYVLQEAKARGLNYKEEFIDKDFVSDYFQLKVTESQIVYESLFLQSKLKRRGNVGREKLIIGQTETHPMFKVIKGSVEDWEKITFIVWNPQNKTLNL